MPSFRDISIRHKLIAIIMATSTVALMLACGTFLAFERIAFRRLLTRQLATDAQIVADSSTAALAFDDRRSANETLAVLRAEPDLVSACIYTKDGRPFAAFLRGESRRDLPRRPGPEGVTFQDHHLLLFRRITFDGERIGTVYLKRDLRDMYARLEHYAEVMFGVLLFASLTALALSSRLQRVISDPILCLARTATRVSAERDYSLRAARRGGDETGVLVDSFNGMMAQIQGRTSDLDAARDALEQHVAGLREEIAVRQRVEVELLAAKQAAEESSRAKSTFLANMSHELRTPLNAIIGYSEILGEDAYAAGMPDCATDLARITAAGKHLLTMINDVLDLSKMEAGKTELLWEEVPVAHILEDAAGAMAPLARKNNNKLIVRRSPDLPPVRVDMVKFRQSLYNLLSNACKFTRDGTVTLDVAPAAVDGAGWIEWRVSDTGIGIAPEQMDKLFKPFSQVDASITRKYGGTGLGLAISQRFCHMMGGEIVVSSEPEKGSTFTIRLPYPGCATVPQPAPARGAAVAPVRQEAHSNRVLVIDDDPAVHDLFKRTLSRQGFDVALAAGGEEGLRKAREVRPSAITLDVVMPGMDGWAVLKALKADAELSGIPVILVTSSDDRCRACIAGAAGFLQKPVETDKLVAILHAAPFRTADRAMLGECKRRVSCTVQTSPG